MSSSPTSSLVNATLGPRNQMRTVSECSDSSETGDQFKRETGPSAVQAAASANPPMKEEVLLYDKYLSKFFNPLHSVPYADHSASDVRNKGVLYDVDGKFGYTTYSERRGNYHPMIDIKKFTQKDETAKD